MVLAYPISLTQFNFPSVWSVLEVRALLQRIVASYEEKQREILQENRDLRAALESLQAEHRAIANQQARF